MAKKFSSAICGTWKDWVQKVNSIFEFPAPDFNEYEKDIDSHIL